MKKSELREIIKEEIYRIIDETDPISKALADKVGIKPTTAKNVMRPKHIDITFTDRGKYYKTLVDKKEQKNLSETEEMLKNLTGINVSLGSMNENELNKLKNILSEKGVTFTWNDSMDVS